MGKPKKNKKAEIKARRKARKIQERVSDLKMREKRARAYLKVLAENAEVLQKLAEAEAQEKANESSSSQDDHSSQSPSE